MSYTVIRFPTAAKLGDKPMATPCGWFELMKRRFFGYHRPRTLTRNTLKFDRARKGQ